MRQPERSRAAGWPIRSGRWWCPARPWSRAQAEEEGLDRVFEEAGFEWRGAGCSMCLGMNPDILIEGERCASTSNRNFEGRQGKGGRTHLVSPKMATAAAIEGPFRRHQELELIAPARPASSRRNERREVRYGSDRTSSKDRYPAPRPQRCRHRPDHPQAVPEDGSNGPDSASSCSTTGSATARSNSSRTRSWSRAATSARVPPVSTRSGRSTSSVSTPSSHRRSRTSSSPTARRTASCRWCWRKHDCEALAAGRSRPDRPREPEGVLGRGRGHLRDRPRDQAPAARRPRRHRADASGRGRDRSAFEDGPGGSYGPVTTALP